MIDSKLIGSVYKHSAGPSDLKSNDMTGLRADVGIFQLPL